MAKFQKGEGGRPKGAKNKDHFGKTKIRSYFESGGLESLLADIEELEAKDKVQAKIKLIEYYMPKQRETVNKHELKNGVLSLNLTKPTQSLPTSENEMFDDD